VDDEQEVRTKTARMAREDRQRGHSVLLPRTNLSNGS